MKKRVSLVLFVILTLSISILAKPVTLDVWQVGMGNEAIDILQAIIEEEFTAKTGIRVRMQVYNWADMQNKVLLAAASGDTPDVVSGAPDHMVEYGIRDAVLDLKAAFGEEKVRAIERNLYPGTTSSLNFRGRVFGLVETCGVISGFYRNDILTELGLGTPKTWDDLRSMIPKLQAREMNVGWNYGGIPSSPKYGAYVLIKQNGGGWVDGESFKSLLTLPGSINGFTQYCELFTKYKMPQDGDPYTLFKAGEWPIVFNINVFHATLTMAAPEIAGKWSLGLIPGTVQPDGTTSHESFMGGSTLAIFNNSKHKEEAFRYLEWYLSDETQIRVTDAIMSTIPGTMWVSGNMAAASAMKMPEKDREVLFDQLSQSKTFSYFPGSMAIQRELDFAVMSVLQLGTDPKDALANAAKTTENELDRKQREYQRYLDKMI
ncbi:MAG: extracellular solute-binding protein [Firmicutes bacterium]|nr:extracellular solute-binding protein [Bacillota bacterium]MDD4263655.1 extracellular solute-binding protein [Bacillota bacterium]MDD4694216.1 extracellular solute-binding protein [Bacillota bacterium]